MIIDCHVSTCSGIGEFKEVWKVGGGLPGDTCHCWSLKFKTMGVMMSWNGAEWLSMSKMDSRSNWWRVRSCRIRSRLWERNKYCQRRMVKRGDEENVVDTAKFISWSRRSRESSAEVRRGYSSWEDEEERKSEEVNILLMKHLDVLANGMQMEGKRSFWECFSCQIVLIPFKESPSSSGFVQKIVYSPHLLHFHVFECR